MYGSTPGIALPAAPPAVRPWTREVARAREFESGDAKEAALLRYLRLQSMGVA